METNKPNREALLKTLRTSPSTTVTFTKVDDTQRVMNCTLMEGHVPAAKTTETKSTRVQDDNVICVYDIDKKAWRSFRVDSVTSTSLLAQ